MTDGDFIEFRNMINLQYWQLFSKLLLLPFIFVVEAGTCAGRTSVKKVNVFTLMCAESLQPVFKNYAII